jgi:hypothetical protein
MLWASLPATRALSTAPDTSSIGVPTGISINYSSRGNIVELPLWACYRAGARLEEALALLLALIHPSA